MHEVTPKVVTKEADSAQEAADSEPTDEDLKHTETPSVWDEYWDWSSFA